MSDSCVGYWLPCFLFIPNISLASARKQSKSGSPLVVIFSIINTLILLSYPQTVPRTYANSPGGSEEEVRREIKGKEMHRMTASLSPARGVLPSQ